MITYDYDCTKCEVAMEVMHSIKANPNVKCPECSAKMERAIYGSSRNIIIKSGNIYIGDVWEKQGVEPENPEYMKKAMEHRRKTKQILLSSEESDEKAEKLKRGEKWNPSS